ncbi:hypothetical protein [Trichocoleus sp. FACHB-591]|nr:hypothetical protein [Trichocoleus sp. FACHB-591]
MGLSSLLNAIAPELANSSFTTRTPLIGKLTVDNAIAPIRTQ